MSETKNTRRSRARAIRYALCLSLAMALAGHAELPRLAGMLYGTIQPGVYLVTSDIIVPPGETVRISGETVLLFSSFTGLQVQGVLIAEGSNRKPIVFSSANDQTYNTDASAAAAPYDWNGVDVLEDAIGSKLAHVQIQYSVYGLKALTELIELKHVTFSDNGKADFTLQGTPMPVEEGVAFSYGSPRKAARIETEGTAETDPLQKKRRVFRIGGGALVLAGAVSGVYFHSRYIKSNRRFNDISQDTQDNKGVYTTADWESAKKERAIDLVAALTGYGFGFLGAVGFALSFTF